VSFHDLSAASSVPQSLYRRSVADLSHFREKAQPIIDAVRRDGDAALLRFAKLHDAVTAETMSIRAEASEFDAAERAVPREVVTAIKHAIDNIRRFHQAQKPEEMWLKEIEPGVWVGDRHVPIESVACYVPRGKGSFPSVLNMTASPRWLPACREPL
jgi:histidinol dehydrogenase